MKKNNEKKDKIKKTVLKILHVVSYVLSFGFIIVCILVGVGSCNNKKSHDPQRQEMQIHERVKLDNSFKYAITLKSNITTYWENERISLSSHTDVVAFSDNIKIIAPTDTTFGMTFKLNGAIYDYSNRNETYYKDYTMIGMGFYHSGVDTYLIDVYLYNENNDDNLFLYSNYGGTPQDNKTLIYYDEVSFVGSNITPYPENSTFDYMGFFGLFFDVFENENLSYWFNVNEVNPIEYYAYEVMNDNTVHNTGSWTGHIDLDMVFVSMGRVFKSLRFQYDYVLGSYYNSTLTTYNDMTYLALSYISYQDYHTNEWIKVCYPRIYKYETRTINNTSILASYPFTDFSIYLWINEGYKDINIVSGSTNVYSTSSADPTAYLTNYQILNYNGQLNNTYVSGNNGTNVFVLLGNAFQSVSGLFAIGLLPGITIGTLLFLPLVVLIIFAIIKIIHK